MELLSLNIYGENDEILKTYSTDHIRWKLFIDAVKVNGEIEKKSAEKQLEEIGSFMKSVFVGLTDDELEKADVFDIFNVFNTIVRKANSIKDGGGKKRLTGAENAPAHTVDFELYALTFTVSDATKADVFRIFDSAADDVIDIINYLLDKAGESKDKPAPKSSEKPESDDTFRVGGKKHDEIWDYI